MRTIGIDLGYSETKAVSDGGAVTRFPSVVGSADIGFSLDGDLGGIYLELPKAVAIGQAAVEQSRVIAQRESRDWILSDEWLLLALASITEIATGSSSWRVVAGLPCSFIDDASIVEGRLVGAHSVKRIGRRAQTVTIESARVVPQPYGSLLDAVMNDDGRIIDKGLAGGRVVVIDIGSHTTNFLSVTGLRALSRETKSASVGGWTVQRAVEDAFTRELPGLESLRPHEQLKAIIAGEVSYRQERVSIRHIVDPILDNVAGQICGVASSLWNGATTADTILLTGGGALLLGDRIRQDYPNAITAGDPVLGNARGFWKLANWESRKRTA